MRGGSLGEHVPKWVVELCGQAQSRFTATAVAEIDRDHTGARSIFRRAAYHACRAVRAKLPRPRHLRRELTCDAQRESAAWARPEIDLRIVPNAGHFFPLTKPEAFTAPVLEFMRVSETARQNNGGEHDLDGAGDARSGPAGKRFPQDLPQWLRRRSQRVCLFHGMVWRAPLRRHVSREPHAAQVCDALRQDRHVACRVPASELLRGI